MECRDEFIIENLPNTYLQRDFYRTIALCRTAMFSQVFYNFSIVLFKSVQYDKIGN